VLGLGFGLRLCSAVYFVADGRIVCRHRADIFVCSTGYYATWMLSLALLVFALVDILTSLEILRSFADNCAV